MSEQRCGTCKHFDAQLMDGYGTCEELGNPATTGRSKNLAFAEGYDEFASFNVRPEFGCVLWEPKSPKEHSQPD